MIPDITADRCRFELDDEGNMIVYGQSTVTVKHGESSAPTFALTSGFHCPITMTGRELIKFWKRLKQLHNRYHREVRTYKRRKEKIRRMHLKGKRLNLHTNANSVVKDITGGNLHYGFGYFANDNYSKTPRRWECIRNDKERGVAALEDDH